MELSHSSHGAAMNGAQTDVYYSVIHPMSPSARDMGTRLPSWRFLFDWMEGPIPASFVEEMNELVEGGLGLVSQGLFFEA